MPCGEVWRSSMYKIIEHWMAEHHVLLLIAVFLSFPLMLRDQMLRKDSEALDELHAHVVGDESSSHEKCDYWEQGDWLLDAKAVTILNRIRFLEAEYSLLGEKPLHRPAHRSSTEPVARVCTHEQPEACFAHGWRERTKYLSHACREALRAHAREERE